MMRELLLTAIERAIAAGEEIMKIYSESFEVVLKSDNSQLTIVDKNANAIINSYLDKTACPIISEENKQTAYTLRKHWNTCWMADLLDGTKEFVNLKGAFLSEILTISERKL